MPDLKHIAGARELGAALLGIATDMREEVLVSATKSACTPILKAAKRYAKRSEDTGALIASLTMKVVGYPSGKAVGLVGPGRDFYSKGRKASKLTRLLKQVRRPSQYAHLIEYGHASVSPTKGTSLRKKTAKLSKTQWVPAKPFIRPAVMTTSSEQADGFFNGLKSGYEKSVQKRVKAGTHKPSR